MDFSCQGCGVCCRIKDGIVRVSEAEIARIADYLGMCEADFIANETDVAPDRAGLILKSHPDGACVYLTPENRCRIHAVKPDKCRSFPYDWVNEDSYLICSGLTTTKDVTIIIYTFPKRGEEAKAFKRIEAAILRTWKVLGLLQTVIVVSHEFDAVVRFASLYSNVTIKLQPALVFGDINSMSYDCIVNLHRYFTTPYCLIIQEDGFPLQNRLCEFLGKYDFIGAPSIRDGRRKWLNALGIVGLNGGFSLRSHRICEAASRDWQRFWRFVINPQTRFFAEDTYYTVTALLNPFYRFRYHFPSEKEAFRFSYDSLNGLIAPPKELPFGFHGKKTAEYYLKG